MAKLKKEQLEKMLIGYRKNHPEFGQEVDEILEYLKKEDPDNQTLEAVRKKCEILFEREKKKERKDGSPQETGVVYKVYEEYPPDIRQRLQLAETDPHYQNWANAVKALPRKTLPLPVVDSAFIKSAREKWEKNIYGNEDVLQIVLRHIVEYGKTGKTAPILLVGPPGIGKTLIARNYGLIMGLPFSFISAPSASLNRGLSGAPNLYVGAGAGAVAQAMINGQAGNPVICIDEIEKAGSGYSGGPGFHNELLAAMDESNTHWHDNFIEMDLDASHIPYVFTANTRDTLSAPLLDRMEIVEMKAPEKEVIYNILKGITVPESIAVYDSDQVLFEEKEISMLVELLWEKGNLSCRRYQRAVDFLISDACLKAIEAGKTVSVTEKDVRQAAERCSQQASLSVIGF